jgi:hypothetical protein
MTPEQRRRAGQAVASRIKEMQASPVSVARAAGIDPKTLRNLIDGRAWPTNATQGRIEEVLRWRQGELTARATNVSAASLLVELTDSEIAAELWRRCRERETRESRLRRTDRRGS